MKPRTATAVIVSSAALAFATASTPALASSHMDAPLITFDDPANTTDVYAFRSKSEGGGTQYLTTALAVYPFEEPGIGPNTYRFDDRVLYEIHVALDADAASGSPTFSYQFEFQTSFQNQDTIRQAYLGPIEETFGANQNLRQTYRVTKVDHGSGTETVLLDFGETMVPPNNQGLVTPFYNRGNNGERPAKEGVTSETDLDRYTFEAIAEQIDGYRAFAGQRDDGFFADIQSIFDLDFSFGQNTGTATKPFDSQGGFNLHTIVLNIPVSELGGAEVAGVYATTSREQMVDGAMQYVQVGRQGNPLFAEALVALVDKDLYNQSQPVDDEQFRIYAQDPDPIVGGNTGIEISRLLGLTPPVAGLVASIFIPDVIKVDLTTDPARTPGDPQFNRLSGVPEVVGGNTVGADVLVNAAGQTVFGGWPNGRRFGDDVVDIALIAVGASPAFPAAADGLDFDGVTQNDITYNDVFPYAATPLNGRNHGHHGEAGVTGNNGNGQNKS